LDETPQRRQMIADLAEALSRLLPISVLPDQTTDPLQRVADAAIDLLQLTSTDVPRTPATNV
jgi:hypothetical protein